MNSYYMFTLPYMNINCTAWGHRYIIDFLQSTNSDFLLSTNSDFLLTAAISQISLNTQLIDVLCIILLGLFTDSE